MGKKVASFNMYFLRFLENNENTNIKLQKFSFWSFYQVNVTN